MVILEVSRMVVFRSGMFMGFSGLIFMGGYCFFSFGVGVKFEWKKV